MGLLVSVLGVSSTVAWAATLVSVVKAFGGSAWAAAVACAAIAIVLTASHRAAYHSAIRRHTESLKRSLHAAAAESPALEEALEYFGSSEYQRSGRMPSPHPTPIDRGGTILLVLSWLCALGGIVVSVIGAFVVLDGSWWPIAFGVVLLLLTGPLHAAQKYRYASHILAVYEQVMVGPLPQTPTRELRLALWQYAQAVSPAGGNTDLRVAQMVEAYAELVAAWGEDQRSAPST